MVLFWVSVLALAVLLYVLLDGFDLGVGILFGFAREEASRRAMMGAVAPVWDGNETWLVVTGVVLWGAFPLAYSILFAALYVPVLFMLTGLILRGVAFEFRNGAGASRWVWSVAFFGGSLLAAFMQGVMVGALVEGLAVSGGHYVGGAMSWLTPFAVLSGLGLCLGYALLGAGWVLLKSDGELLRATARRWIPRLALALLAVLIAVFVYALAKDLRILHSWLERPYLFVLPAVAVAAAAILASRVRQERYRDRTPFEIMTVLFATAFGTFLISFWPYMIPFSVTIDQAAAPHSSLAFMFWGEGLFILPLMLFYTFVAYGVFRGKLRPAETEY
jgi:cytochrome bd ubiquinol oxidase subunit II